MKWPAQFAINQIEPMHAQVEVMQQQIAELQAEVRKLKETKADRRGRKPTGGQSSG